MFKDSLKNMIDAIINGKEDDARSTFHTFFKNKSQVVLGLRKVEEPTVKDDADDKSE